MSTQVNLEDSMKKAILFFLFISTSFIYPQQYVLKGKVVDKISMTPLSFANIRISGSTKGTAANAEGSYEFKLVAGNYVLIASFIGYKSDTAFVKLDKDKTVNFFLAPVPVRLKEITVLPKENPALEIIRRTISAKHEREAKLNSYEFNAYTKGIIRTTKDIVTSDRSVGYSLTEKDTGDLKITGIIENESRGYFKKPDYYKDEIIARKQSANAPSTINILTGGRLLQNFYTNDIQFFNRPLVGPISDNALDYYYYILEDTLAMDKRNVFQISFEPIDKSDPGFYGKLFIVDSIFALAKLDVNLNDAANPGGIFNRINIFQQFVPYDQNIYMPIDYRVFVEGNFLGIAKFGFELNSIFYDYKINASIDDDFFGMAVVKVLPDADNRDSTYWKSVQTIPNSLEEKKAYNRIDSLESVPKTFWDNFSILSTSLYLNDNMQITGPLGLYSFNKVEGHTVNFGLSFYNEFDKRFNGHVNLDYGFSDKKIKSDVSAKYYLGDYRTALLSFNMYNKLTDLFRESVFYNKLTSTLTSLLGKYDFRDYYYTKGWDINIYDDVFPILRLGAGFLNRTDNNAFNTSDFSILNKSKKYRMNKNIYETKVNALTASFTLDYRKYIEDGYRRLRISQNKPYFTLNGEALFSKNSLLNSNLDFDIYKLNIYGNIPNYKSSNMSLNLKGIYSNGPVPFQMMYSLPGNIEGASKSFSFRTIDLGEIYGDKGITLSVQQNFYDEVFRFLEIPYIKDWQLILTAHFNAALLEISDKSKSILPDVPFTEFKHPFYEIGFGIGQMLFPLSVEFTWKLNYFGRNNFVISLNTFAL